MSVKLMSQAWQTDCGGSTAKLVLVALADNANDAGVAWPSLATLAAKCDLTRQGVIGALRRLEKDGLVAKRKIPGKGNVYRVLPRPGPVTEGDQRRAEMVPPEAMELVNVVDQPKGGTGNRGLLPPVTDVDQHQSPTLTSRREPLVTDVDGYWSTTLTGLVNVVDPNHQEPSVEPVHTPRAGGAGGAAAEESPRIPSPGFPSKAAVLDFCRQRGWDLREGTRFWCHFDAARSNGDRAISPNWHWWSRLELWMTETARSARSGRGKPASAGAPAADPAAAEAAGEWAAKV